MSGFEFIKRGAGYWWDLGRVLQGVQEYLGKGEILNER